LYQDQVNQQAMPNKSVHENKMNHIHAKAKTAGRDKLNRINKNIKGKRRHTKADPEGIQPLGAFRTKVYQHSVASGGAHFGRVFGIQGTRILEKLWRLLPRDHQIKDLPPELRDAVQRVLTRIGDVVFKK
jgi:hypothetical protein